MKWMGTILCLLLPGIVAVSGQAQAPKDGVQLQTVKYDGLKDVIHKNSGKVVLVDFWADFCAPCKKAFPRIIEIGTKHKNDGLVVVSVSLDPIDEPAARENALKFLKKVGAAFTNLYLDEPSELWQKKLGFAGPPCYYVFNRHGQWMKFEPKGDDPVDYPAMEKYIANCLTEKQ